MAQGLKLPLFVPMQIEDKPNETYDYLMCVWHETNDEYCSETCGDFLKMINHLRQDHGLELKQKVDFCTDCETLFGSKIESLQHYVSHALTSQHFTMSCENNPEEASELGEWLKPIYWKLAQIHKTIMNRVLFSDDLPEESQDYVSFDEVDRTMIQPQNGFDVAECSYSKDVAEYPYPNDVAEYPYPNQ